MQDLPSLYISEMNPTFGVCVPSACTNEDVYNNYAAIWDGINAAGLPLSCETRETQDQIEDLSGTATVVAM